MLQCLFDTNPHIFASSSKIKGLVWRLQASRPSALITGMLGWVSRLIFGILSWEPQSCEWYLPTSPTGPRPEAQSTAKAGSWASPDPLTTREHTTSSHECVGSQGMTAKWRTECKLPKQATRLTYIIQGKIRVQVVNTCGGAHRGICYCYCLYIALLSCILYKDIEHFVIHN